MRRASHDTFDCSVPKRSQREQVDFLDTQMDKNLDRTGVNDSLFSIETLSDGIFCYDSFSSTSMSGH